MATTIQTLVSGNALLLTSRALRLGPLAALAAAGCFLAACGPADELNGEGASQATALSGECSQSEYNCALPASPHDRNRIFNYATNSYDWPIANGAHLRDGLGNIRGVVVDSAVKINYGGRKRINGVNHVYAFAARLDTGITASGWVREGALNNSPISRMPTVALSDPGHGDYETVFTVTGGNNADFEGLKVSKDYDDGGRNATDYLVRPGNMFNLLYNLPGRGGVATDTFPLGVSFRRCQGVLHIDINLYEPSGTKVVRTMPFVYGHVGSRYGWVAKDALDTQASAAAPAAADPGTAPPSSGDDPAAGPGTSDPAPPPAPATGQCYARCCDESLQGPMQTSDPSSCLTASQAACDPYGHVKRIEFNQSEVWARSNSCWAKCKNRDAYHLVDGVTQDCTQHASDYCAVSDRGGLQDAAWSQCQP